MTDYFQDVEPVEIELINLIFTAGIRSLLTDLYLECNAMQKAEFKQWAKQQFKLKESE